jgi:hypothetical protein
VAGAAGGAGDSQVTAAASGRGHDAFGIAVPGLVAANDDNTALCMQKCTLAFQKCTGGGPATKQCLEERTKC